MKKKAKKVNHDYVCDVCGKPATVNIQNAWYKYSIDKDGETREVDQWEGDVNEFYCDKHEE
jgi:hypothetical protein